MNTKSKLEDESWKMGANSQRTLAGMAWLAVSAGVCGIVYLLWVLALVPVGHWLWTAVSWSGCKRVLSFTAFWLLVFAFIRALWHLGSMFKAKARKA